MILYAKFLQKLSQQSYLFRLDIIYKKKMAATEMKIFFQNHHILITIKILLFFLIYHLFSTVWTEPLKNTGF